MTPGVIYLVEHCKDKHCKRTNTLTLTLKAAIPKIKNAKYTPLQTVIHEIFIAWKIERMYTVVLLYSYYICIRAWYTVTLARFGTYVAENIIATYK